ncbi:hypothetical protein LWF15_08050 [Kineosporia rhizophila]|uniref:hypothetical protein n=1 Tax=Kineosporia rhizophila TaxID=84633 RepID=UPI001E4FD430|nr:hypothetical protein [Kineosporia rhizophila]MCE0535458.1 hypothetical protein [Kineosporia rhizophila]
MPPTQTLTPASYLRSIRAMPQPSRALSYALPLAWLFAIIGFLSGFIFDLDVSLLKWFVLPFLLTGATGGLVVALNIRDNAAGVNDAMREQGMPTISPPFYRVFAAATSAMALGMAVTILGQDF